MNHRQVREKTNIRTRTCQTWPSPTSSMLHIHPVFHIIKLMPVPPDPIRHHTKLPPPEIIGGEERYEVKEVINSRFWHKKLQYLVKWKGYGHKENLWLSEGDIDVLELITCGKRPLLAYMGSYIKISRTL